MESWCVSKMKSWMMIMMILILMVSGIVGGCIGKERKALLEIKTSFIHSYGYVAPPLLSWVDDGGECCGWERVNCNITTAHVTNLSLGNMLGFSDFRYKDCQRIWELNVSVFVDFKELTSLNLSRNCLDDGIVNTGLEKLSSLKMLEILDLSSNSITNETLPSLGALTSLRVLNLRENELKGYFPALENLEILDLSDNVYMEGFDQVSLLKRLKVLNLGYNSFNESLITSLSALPMLKSLDLRYNNLGRSFPVEELAHLTNLEELDLSSNHFNDIPSIQECTRLSRLEKLKSITLEENNFNKSIISCLNALPSLNTLDLSWSFLGGSFPIQELSQLSRDLEVLLLVGNDFNGTIPMDALASHFHHLEVLDLSSNNFVGSIPPTIQELSSLRVVSFAYNALNGSLPEHGLCELKNLMELDLSHNMFDGRLPQCFNRLSSLKLLDISSNRFTVTLTPSAFANFTSLEYVDFGDSIFEGLFSLSSLSTNTKLVVVRFICNNDEFEVDTEEPLGWIPTFQLKVLVLSGCNINRHKGSVVPRFLLHQRMLQIIDLSDNSLVGQFPNWLIENNTMLEALVLRKNSFSGIIHMPLHMNANMRSLDVSENHMNGIIPDDIHKFLPNVYYLNLSTNSLHDVIPSSIGYLSELWELDLSDNELSGEVPKGLLSNLSSLWILKLSRNRLNGEVLSGNLSLGNIERLHLDNNSFTGEIGNKTNNYLGILDISYNSFKGTIPHWISKSDLDELVVSNNHLEGQFPCGTTPFSFLDISQNSFSGPIPSCLNFQEIQHLHLGSNRFTGSIPNAFRNLTYVLTLDIGNNSLSGKIPEFLGELSNLRILILRKNNFSGSIPKFLCQLGNVSLIDLSSNSLSGSIPSCLQNITTPVYPAFIPDYQRSDPLFPEYNYQEVLLSLHYDTTSYDTKSYDMTIGKQDEVEFTTKYLSLAYKGQILDLMVGLDLSNNKLTGEIPKELGLLIEIRSLNLSHNQLSGPIPVTFSNLEMIESLDLSSNSLTGEVPSQLIQLHYLSAFNVSDNNLSDNFLVGQFPNWLIENNTMLEALILRKNSFSGIIHMPLHMNGNMRWLDVSENHMNGIITDDIHKFLPNVYYLNLSTNSLHDVIPSSIGDLSELRILDLSANELSGEVPKGLLSNLSSLEILKLSRNRLHGEVLSGNLSLSNIEELHLDNNSFTGEIGNGTNNFGLWILDISYNSFKGTIPHWISNMDSGSELLVSNNHLEGQFPCETASFSFLDISQNSFSGPIPSCLDFQYMRHLHLGSNRFIGSIPKSFRNLTDVLTLDIGNNSLSGKIPEFLGELSNLRILILRKNNFSGSIPKKLCQLGNVSLIDLSSNSLSGSIPSCLQNITTPVYPAFKPDYIGSSSGFPYYYYPGVLRREYHDTNFYDVMITETQDEVEFTTKTLSLAYKGKILDYMVGLDLSGNKLTGDIPEELGLLIEIRSLNLSHNQLSGPIPVTFSNLEMIESLDLSSNSLTGEVPSQLIQLHYLSAFNVSDNNLSGRLPDMKAQFSTFTNESYQGNPLLCGLPLEKKCAATSQVTDPSAKEGDDKWYDIDMVSFYGSCGATWVVFLLGFGAVLYINPYWRRRWLDLVEECMYTCYYFFDDCVRKLRMLFRK